MERFLIGDFFENPHPAGISLDNGTNVIEWGDLTSHEAEINAVWDVIVDRMDDAVREAIHYKMAPCSNVDFLKEYLKNFYGTMVI